MDSVRYQPFYNFLASIARAKDRSGERTELSSEGVGKMTELSLEAAPGRRAQLSQGMAGKMPELSLEAAPGRRAQLSQGMAGTETRAESGERRSGGPGVVRRESRRSWSCGTARRRRRQRWCRPTWALLQRRRLVVTGCPGHGARRSVHRRCRMFSGVLQRR